VSAFRINRGNLYFIESRFEEAAREYQVALQLDPATSTARYYLGLSYAQMGRWREAIGEWEKLQELARATPA
jgi:tetratricopeptide (TPR) repeat protein